VQGSFLVPLSLLCGGKSPQQQGASMLQFIEPHSCRNCALIVRKHCVEG
jgi:hypothetical protein